MVQASKSLPMNDKTIGPKETGEIDYQREPRVRQEIQAKDCWGNKALITLRQAFQVGR